MTIYTVGQMVTYKGKKWLIAGFKTDDKGHTIYLIKRGPYRAEADETEVE